MLGHVDGTRTGSPSEPEDTVLDGRYRLEGTLGHGGMATVHRAHDLLLGRAVAVKVFPMVHQGDDELLRNRAEILVLAALSHPALVTLYDAGAVELPDGGRQDYLVMELVDGPTLAERLHRGPLDDVQTARVGRDVAEALAEVHAQGVIHRDIKPGNVLLTGADALDLHDTSAPAVKLADFGIARLVDGTRLTLTGQTLGTVSYLSPEQATGSGLGTPSDVYSLGLVLIECASGRPAFSGTPAEVAVARLTAAPEVPPTVGAGLGALLTRMTAMAPEDRPSAAEVAVALAAMVPSERTLRLPTTDPLGPVPGPPEPTRRSHRRLRPALLAAGVAVLLTVGGLAVTEQVSQPDATPAPPTYPAVDGSLGESLTRLQESVEP